jgi:DNA-binding protein H-NS
VNPVNTRVAFSRLIVQSLFDLTEEMLMVQRLTSMSVEALLTLRDQIGSVLSNKAATLKKELTALGADFPAVGHIAVPARKKSLAGTKVAPKYRDPKSGMTWAGRGAQPVWMREAIKRGKKPDDFLIARANGTKESTPKKLGRPKKKR